MLVVQNTPWEVYQIDGIDVHVKREDLSCPEPGPSFSKIRGVEMAVAQLDESIAHVGVLDTFHSKAGWGVAYVCRELGYNAHVFYPVYKAEGTLDRHKLRDAQRWCLEMGAKLYPLQAGRSAILFHQAKKILELDNPGRSYMMPNGLKLDETVDATAAEVEAYTPCHLFKGTWIVSISSGTICAGVIKALRSEPVIIIAHMGYHRSMDQARKYMLDKAGGVTAGTGLLVIDEAYQYKDGITESCPFPCNPYYDLKAWRWLKQNIRMLEPPIIFWNIGS